MILHIKKNTIGPQKQANDCGDFWKPIFIEKLCLNVALFVLNSFTAELFLCSR